MTTSPCFAPSEFIAEVLGLPYCPRNRNGLNCWGVVVMWCARLGRIVPSYTIDSVTTENIVAAFTAAFTEGGHGYRKTDTPADGDVIVFTGARFHCGLLFGKNVLHAAPGGVVLQPLTTIRGFTGREFWTYDENNCHHIAGQIKA